MEAQIKRAKEIWYPSAIIQKGNKRFDEFLEKSMKEEYNNYFKYNHYLEYFSPQANGAL